MFFSLSVLHEVVGLIPKSLENGNVSKKTDSFIRYSFHTLEGFCCQERNALCSIEFVTILSPMIRDINPFRDLKCIYSKAFIEVLF